MIRETREETRFRVIAGSFRAQEPCKPLGCEVISRRVVYPLLTFDLSPTTRHSTPLPLHQEYCFVGRLTPHRRASPRPDKPSTAAPTTLARVPPSHTKVRRTPVPSTHNRQHAEDMEYEAEATEGRGSLGSDQKEEGDSGTTACPEG